ncbi:MAG: hydrogenase maturation nickel metallochaperone HypA [Tabrizicola sp.]|nr:hydrogenase maturation nickel metallochaperone HypA [Tabrizicola sp.]
MHEMSLCESILDIIRDRAGQDRFSRVTRVCLEVGPLSSVEPEALRFGFDVVMRGSLAEGAALEIETPEATAFCVACLSSVPVRNRLDPCPACGSADLQITGGDDLRIRQLEVI